MFVATYLGHFPAKLDDLRCVGKVFLTSFKTIRSSKFTTKWTAINVSSSIDVAAFMYSFQVPFMYARPSAQIDTMKVCISPKFHAKRFTFKYSTDCLVFV